MNPSYLHGPLTGAIVLAVVAVVSLLAFRNRVIRRRMIFTLVVIAALIALHVANAEQWLALAGFKSTGDVAANLEEVLLALAGISVAVALIFNPWFSDRVRDRAPAIVQDTIVIGLLLMFGMFVFHENAQLFAGSAIAAAVLGFALQETLGNLFAGLAIQTEKPFKVGHWVTVASYDGRVTEVTWRATKIRTKNGNLVTLPNNVVAREPITNYSEPTAPTRLSIEIGASYLTPPNETRDAILTALKRVPRVLETPKPDVILNDFGASALTYLVRFWIDDFEFDIPIRDQVRTAIYYELHRRDIEIPWPIQIQYPRFEIKESPEHRRDRFTHIIAGVSVLAPLLAEGHQVLAEASSEHLFGNGEVIVREGDAGSSMFVVYRGQVTVTIGKGHEVARIAEGGFFGEMSLLTGEPRAATVTAVGDCGILEISGRAFKAYVTAHPEVIDQLAGAAAERRRALDQSRVAAAVTPQEARVSLADRMRRFFGMV